MQLTNPAQDRARAALSLERLGKTDRAKLGILFRRFMAALEHQRRFDRQVAASIERLAREPAFKEQIAQLLSTKENSDAVYR